LWPAVLVYQIRADLVELVFDPRSEDLRVGESLVLREADSGRALVVQVLGFRTVTYPALIREEFGLQAGEPPAPDEPDLKHLKVAQAKVRKLAGRPWENWDGWIPHREVVVERVGDREVLRHCVADLGNRIHLGRTLQGDPFYVEGQALEKVNVITGAKGSGKSHLAKVLLMRLIEQGAPCIVFDINREYVHLPPLELDLFEERVVRPGIVHLRAGRNLKLGIRQFGLGPLLTMLTRFGLPEASALYFENRVARLLAEIRERERTGQKVPFIGIDQLIQLAEENEYYQGGGSLWGGGDRVAGVINGAIRSRLEALKNTGLFATHPKEATSVQEHYARIRNGGALVIDIADLPNLAKVGFVQAILEMVKDICEAETSAESGRYPFVFFEEAHLYVQKASIDYIVTRARHLGLTSFFVTNMVSGLDEVVLRQADNLFLLTLPYEDDVRHVAKSAIIDQETLVAFVRRLKRHHVLVVGQATGGYPVIVKVDPLSGVNTAGETRYFFRPRVAVG
jgi:energy-coupling factor transporter ATP-binding protein EcfA2